MNVPNYSIGIQTYVYRFDSYFKTLIARLHRNRPNVEKVVFINGQNNESFSQEYRRDILTYLSAFPNIYPVMSPFMRGCSFMWNTSLNFTSHDYMLNMSDDVAFNDGFFDDFEKILLHNSTQGDETFRINHHWTVFCAYRKDMIDPSRVGYFDERLIGFGEEDGDWMWRFEHRFGRHMRNYNTPNLLFNVDNSCLPGKNTKCTPGTKWTAFNRNFMFNHKMEPDPTGTNRACGCLDTPHKTRTGMETPNMYPGETWFREHKHEM